MGVLRDRLPTGGDLRHVRIGLLGGSFNPAHEGHIAIALRAARQLGLDQVWLMVSPGNPLKPRHSMAPLEARLASVRRLVRGPRLVPTVIESRLRTRYAVDTLRTLKRRFPQARFVWLMGADVFAELPRWSRWRAFVRAVPIAVLPRPGSNIQALHGQTASVLRRFRVGAYAAGEIVDRRPPVWAFLPGPQNVISATALRRAGQKAFIESTQHGRHHPAGDTVIARKPPSDTEPKRRTAAKTAAALTGATKVATKPKAPKPVDARLAEAAKAPGTPRKKAAAAGPGKDMKKRPHAPVDELEKYLKIISDSIDDDKGENIVVIDLTGRASFADRMVIATGVADRQIAAMAQHIDRKLTEAGLKRILIEGANGSDWVLIDAGDIVIHLFKAEARELYGLERMWGAELDDADEATITTL